MRKFIIASFLLITGITKITAQIGIQTSNPQGAFHIDGGKDNPAAGLPNAAQQSNDVVITSQGNMGIGNATPTSKLEVNGASTNTSAYNAGSGTAIDYSLSNLAYTTASAGAFTLNNIKDGGTYTLSVRGTVSGTSSFAASGFTVKYANNKATTTGTETLYTLIVIGSTLYVYMASGF